MWREERHRHRPSPATLLPRGRGRPTLTSPAPALTFRWARPSACAGNNFPSPTLPLTAPRGLFIPYRPPASPSTLHGRNRSRVSCVTAPPAANNRTLASSRSITWLGLLKLQPAKLSRFNLVSQIMRCHTAHSPWVFNLSVFFLSTILPAYWLSETDYVMMVMMMIFYPKVSPNPICYGSKFFFIQFFLYPYFFVLSKSVSDPISYLPFVQSLRPLWSFLDDGGDAGDHSFFLLVVITVKCLNLNPRQKCTTQDIRL